MVRSLPSADGAGRAFHGDENTLAVVQRHGQGAAVDHGLFALTVDGDALRARERRRK